MKSPIFGSAYVARSVNAADNRMVNLFPEAIPDGGQTGGFLNQKSGTDKYDLMVTTVGSGSFEITLRTTGGTTVETPVFSFAVISGAVS